MYASLIQVIIRSGNGLSLIRHQVITWANVDLVLVGSWRKNFIEIWIQMQIFPFKKIHLKMSLQNGTHFVSASVC